MKEGVIDCISTDHCPYYSSEKETGNVWSSPPGLPGLEYAFPLVATYAIEKAGLSLPEVQRLFSENPARILGLYPTLGSLSVGSYANIVLVRTGVEAKIDDSWVKSATDYTPYEGFKVKFIVEKTICRGVVVAENREVTVKPGYGRFVSYG